MEYGFIIPAVEVLIFNLVTLDHCLTRRYTFGRTAAVILMFTALLFMAVFGFLGNEIQGDGRFTVVGFIYIIPLKILYEEKLDVMILNICMSWIYTLGVQSVSIQAAHFLSSADYDITVVLIETILFLVTFFPFRKHMIPGFSYIIQQISGVGKNLFRHLEISIFLNFMILNIIHQIFLNNDRYLLQIAVLVIYLISAYILYGIVYEVIRSTVKVGELKRTAAEDPLTGLGNRSRLIKDMNRLIEDNQTFSVIFLDLDRFKDINDMYGHDMGDRYLMHFGKVFSEELGENGRLYRYAGDEFAAVYYGRLDDERLGRMTDCSSWGKDAPCGFNQVSAGMVVCTPPYDVADPDRIVKLADVRMYRDKMSRKRIEQ